MIYTALNIVFRSITKVKRKTVKNRRYAEGVHHRFFPHPGGQSGTFRIASDDDGGGDDDDDDDDDDDCRWWWWCVSVHIDICVCMSLCVFAVSLCGGRLQRER